MTDNRKICPVCRFITNTKDTHCIECWKRGRENNKYVYQDLISLDDYDKMEGKE